MPDAPLPPRLLFDGDCGFCTKSVNWLGKRHMLGCRVTPWQAVGEHELPVSVDRLVTEVVLEQADGTVLGGADALAAAVRASPSPWRPVGALVSLPGIRQLARAVYRVIARNRYRMPGASSSCKIG